MFEKVLYHWEWDGRPVPEVTETSSGHAFESSYSLFK